MQAYVSRRLVSTSTLPEQGSPSDVRIRLMNLQAFMESATFSEMEQTLLKGDNRGHLQISQIKFINLLVVFMGNRIGRSHWIFQVICIRKRGNPGVHRMRLQNTYQRESRSLLRISPNQKSINLLVLMANCHVWKFENGNGSTGVTLTLACSGGHRTSSKSCLARGFR